MNSGRLMMGIIGNNDWLDTGVIGDPVNLASRLEGMTKIYGTPFLISEKTADRVQDRDAVPLRELDRVRAKGKRQAVCIYEVLGALSDERRAQVEATREAFAAALELYRAGKFEEAGAAFQSCNSAAPLDLVAALYIGRCSAMAANPPRKWDGITTLTRK